MIKALVLILSLSGCATMDLQTVSDKQTQEYVVANDDSKIVRLEEETSPESKPLGTLIDYILLAIGIAILSLLKEFNVKKKK